MVATHVKTGRRGQVPGNYLQTYEDAPKLAKPVQPPTNDNQEQQQSLAQPAVASAERQNSFNLLGDDFDMFTNTTVAATSTKAATSTAAAPVDTAVDLFAMMTPTPPVAAPVDLFAVTVTPPAAAAEIPPRPQVQPNAVPKTMTAPMTSSLLQAGRSSPTPSTASRSLMSARESILSRSGRLSCPPFITDPVAFHRFYDLFKASDKDGDGSLTGREARPIFYQSGLAKEELARMWRMCDLDRNGAMSVREFILGMWLVACVASGAWDRLPNALDASMVAWANKGAPVLGLDDGSPLSAATTSSISPTYKWGGSGPALHSTTSRASTAPAGPAIAKSRSGSVLPAATSAVPKQSPATTQPVSNASVNATTSTTSTDRAAIDLAWQNRDTVAKVAQSEEGRRALQAAWQHRDVVVQAAQSETGQQVLRGAAKM